jgi:methionyl-tRNA formyltransferase
MQQKLKIIFFGTPKFAKTVLEKMKESGFLPSLIVTQEDKPVGRKLIIIPPEVKVFAQENNIPFLQPKSLKDENFLNEIKSFGTFDIGIVCSYGKIIPENILKLSKNGNLNIHTSLLPKLRGPSPIQSAILSENETGITIMLLDELMDHGPILAQEKIDIYWPPYEEDLEDALSKKGSSMLCDVIMKFLDGKIEIKEQDHSKATFCKKIQKEDALLDLNDDPNLNLRKIRAYHRWPKAYFFQKDKKGKEIRIIVSRADVVEDKLVIEKIIPEGKKEMLYKDFIKNL